MVVYRQIDADDFIDYSGSSKKGKRRGKPAATRAPVSFFYVTGE